MTFETSIATARPCISHDSKIANINSDDLKFSSATNYVQCTVHEELGNVKHEHNFEGKRNLNCEARDKFEIGTNFEMTLQANA